MLPTSRPQIDREKVIDLLIAQGLWKNRSLKKAVIVGIRGYYLDSMGDWGKNDRGIYDDAIIVLTPNGCTTFNGNTDPSRYRKGLATLKAPQKVRYRPGYHGYHSKYGHQAFRQDTPVIVHRDYDTGNGRKLPDGTFTDKSEDGKSGQIISRFWINLHRGGHTTTSSAGCQTIPPSQWSEFHTLVRDQMDQFNQLTINYYLLTTPDLT